MTDGMTLKESIENEKRKWKGMDRKQKFSYYKTYYLVPTIILLVVLIFLVNLVLDITVRRKNVLLDITTVNLSDDEAGRNKLEGDLMKYFDGNEKKDIVSIDVQYFSQNGDPTNTAVMQTKLAGGGIDFFLMDEDGYNALGQFGDLGNLTDYFSEEELSVWQDKIIYLDYKDEYTDMTYAAAIDLSDTAFAKKYFPSSSKIFFAITGNGEHMDRNSDFLKFLKLE